MSKALELAQWCHEHSCYMPEQVTECVSELRRLYAVEQELEAALETERSEAEENCKIIGASAERELALRARVDRLEQALREARDTTDALPGYPKGSDLCDRIDKLLEAK